jgi:DNA-binding IclR family transcriptional regulator
MKGIRAVGALIYSGHFAVAGLWVAGFTSSISDDKLPSVITHVKATAERISSRLSPFLTTRRSVSGRSNGGAD